jgi:8-hydroxy-5-deazaflavin:NADPH oxidoreductase
MKVGVLGSGIVGQVLGGGFAKHGHQVMMGTREPKVEAVRNWIAKTTNASAGTFAEAAQFGDLVVLAVLGRVVEEVIKLAGPASFKGKTVMDTTNPLADAPPLNGVLQFTTGPNESLGERVQALLPGANVVKAFNSVGNTRMVNPQFAQGVPTMFLRRAGQGAGCGNHPPVRMGALRLWRNHCFQGARTAVHALVYTRVLEQPMDTRVQAAYPLKARADQ